VHLQRREKILSFTPELLKPLTYRCLLFVPEARPTFEEIMRQLTKIKVEKSKPNIKYFKKLWASETC